MPKYDLLNAEERNLQFPETFKIPILDNRMSVPDNYWVKLGFIPSDEDNTKCILATGLPALMERMWVQINNRESECGMYYGTLGSIPAVCFGVSIGDAIQFEAKNVFDILSND